MSDARDYEAEIVLLRKQMAKLQEENADLRKRCNKFMNFSRLGLRATSNLLWQIRKALPHALQEHISSKDRAGLIRMLHAANEQWRTILEYARDGKGEQIFALFASWLEQGPATSDSDQDE